MSNQWSRAGVGRQSWGGNKNNNNSRNNYSQNKRAIFRNNLSGSNNGGTFRTNSSAGLPYFSSRKPSAHQGSSQIPSWEKEFCYVIGGVSWRDLLDTHRIMSFCYKNILQWEDSANEEAFNNAKSRFYATKKGFPCDVALPDLDAYIDEIDWDAKIDPELDFDREIPNSEDEPDGKDVQIDSVPLDQKILPPSGWGSEFEEEDRLQKNEKLLLPAGRGEEFEEEDKLQKNENLLPPTGWGSEFEEEDRLQQNENLLPPTGWGEEFEEEDKLQKNIDFLGPIEWVVDGEDQQPNQVNNKFYGSENWNSLDYNSGGGAESSHDWARSRYREHRFSGRKTGNWKGKKKMNFGSATKMEKKKKQTSQQWIPKSSPANH